MAEKRYLQRVSPENAMANGNKPPPYRRIAQKLRDEIKDGHHPVGELLPTQASLVKRFDVSRATVQRALEELRQEGYIDSQQGRGSEVLRQSAEHSPGPVQRPVQREPAAAGVSLGEHIAAAFEADEVTLDAFTLTTETLNQAVQPSLMRIRAGELSPRSITVRLLVPSLEALLALPRSVSDPTDQRPLARLRELVKAHAVSFESSIRALEDRKDRELVPEVKIERRAVAVTPLQKVYLLNGTEALTGFYRVMKRDVWFGKEKLPIYDVLGLEAKLFHHSSADAEVDPMSAVYVEETTEWFESLWSTIAEPLRLFE